MNLTHKDLTFLSTQAISAAKKAGKYIQEEGQKKITSKFKNTGSSHASQIVTHVDIGSQSIILEALSTTCKKFDLALLSEETPDQKERLKKAYFWSIDPLDGTLPFSKSEPGYSVSIGLISNSGTSKLGVVYDPYHQRLYHGIQGNGAFKDGQPCSLDKPKTKDTFTFIIDPSLKSSPHFEFIHKNLLTIGKDLGYKKVFFTNYGGAVLNACQCLEHPPAAYVKFPQKKEGGGSIWDFGATTCLLKEAGLWVSDCSGNPLDLNRKDSTFMNHKGTLFSNDAELARRLIHLNKQITNH